MWFLVVVISFIYTEFIGYVVHRMLHAGWIPKLSQLHQQHHDIYPPNGQQLTDKYLYKKRSTWVEQIGLEWLIPICAITIPGLIFLFLLGVHWKYLLISIFVGIFWAWIGFTWMHEALHLKSFWMKDNYIFGGWYKETRKLHVIHHNDTTVNFGIVFYWFDKLYETFTRKKKGK